jgi:hypothetical protein
VRYFSYLDRSIGAALASSATGRAVFVRAHLALTADHGLLTGVAAAGLSVVKIWMGAEVRSVYALGGAKQGTVSLQVEFAGGETALVAAELTHGGEASVEVLVTGQQGTLRFEDFPDPAMLVPGDEPGAAYRGAIERSLASGKPVRTEAR